MSTRRCGSSGGRAPARSTALLATSLSFLLAAATAVGAAPRTATPAAAPLYARAFADASAAHSAHETALVVGKDFRSTQSENASEKGGNLAEAVTASGAHLAFVSRLIGTKLWVNGDQFALEGELGEQQMTAGLNAGYWISVNTTSKYYEPLAFGLNFPTSLAGISLAPPFTIAGPVSYAGTQAYAISSTLALHLSSSAGPLKGHFTVYISTAEKPLPIAEVDKFLLSKVPEEITVDFSHWGEKVVLNVPKGPRPV
jgi:hypothetical protein